MKKILQSASIVAAFTLATGCASMFSDSSYQVHVQNNNEADRYEVVDINTNHVVFSGHGDNTVKLDASTGFFEKARYDVVFYRDDKEIEHRVFAGEIDGTTWLNLLIAWPGFLVDGGTGAFYKLPEQI